MKKLILLSVLLIVGCYDRVEAWRMISPEEIPTITIELPELSKDEIYEKTYLWLEMTFHTKGHIKEITKNENIIIKGRKLKFKHGMGKCDIIIIVDIKSKKVELGIKKKVKKRNMSTPLEFSAMPPEKTSSPQQHSMQKKELNKSKLEQSYKDFLLSTR